MIDKTFELNITDVKELHKVIMAAKQQSLSMLCTGRAKALEQFSKEIDSLQFESKPNYQRLR